MDKAINNEFHVSDDVGVRPLSEHELAVRFPKKSLLWTTSEGTGYPKNEHLAISDFVTYEEALECAKSLAEHGALPEILERRPGWGHWYRSGTAYGPLKLEDLLEELFGSAHTWDPKPSEEELRAMFEIPMGEDLSAYPQYKKVFESWRTLKDGHVMVMDDSGPYCLGTYPRSSMEYYSYEYEVVVGVVLYEDPDMSDLLWW